MRQGGQDVHGDGKLKEYDREYKDYLKLDAERHQWKRAWTYKNKLIRYEKWEPVGAALSMPWDLPRWWNEKGPLLAERARWKY